MEHKGLLEVRNLKKYFDTNRGPLQAVDNISFSIEKGRTLGVVGESGCGKSTLGRTILRLQEPTSGEIWFNGEDIVKYDKKQVKALRSKMQIPGPLFFPESAYDGEPGHRGAPGASGHL